MPNGTKKTQDSEPVKAESDEGYIHKRIQEIFKLEDFSQKAINEGQQKINYEFSEAGKKFAEAFGLLTGLLVTKATFTKGEMEQINKVLGEAAHIAGNVADIFPPGCPPPVKKDPETE